MVKKQRSRKAVPVLGAASLLMLAGGALAKEATVTSAASSYSFLGEEEISDVSLATFHVFDKERRGSFKLARGGCGGGGGCGCGHGGGCGCHGGGGGCHAGGGCHVGGCGCGGGCHGHGCGCRGRFIGGCGGCGCGGGGCDSGWCWSQGGCNPNC